MEHETVPWDPPVPDSPASDQKRPKGRWVAAVLLGIGVSMAVGMALGAVTSALLRSWPEGAFAVMDVSTLVMVGVGGWVAGRVLPATRLAEWIACFAAVFFGGIAASFFLLYVAFVVGAGA